MTAATDSIRAVLETRLSTMPNVPPIARDNVTYQQTPEVTHIRSQFIPTSRRPAVRGPNPQHRYQGLFILTVRAPERVGTGTALSLADDLLDRFPGASSITGLDVNVGIEYSEALMGYPESPFWCIPVHVAWYAYR
jgi:hypothetical protein